MDDPFPPSLPSLNSPRIYDSSLEATMEDVDGTRLEEPFGPSGGFYVDEGINDSGYAPSAVKTANDAPPIPSRPTDSRWPDSPESLSSSDNSNQHGRKNSDMSSIMGDRATAATPMAKTIMIEADPAPFHPVTEEEACNDFMNSTFDFESASSSPLPTPTTSNISLREPGNNTMRMAARPGLTAKAADRSMSRSTDSSSPPETGLSMFYKGSRRSPHQSGQSCVPRELMWQDNDHRLNGPQQNLAANITPHGGYSYSADASMPVPYQPAISMPFASPEPTRFYVSRFQTKSRVETQHTLKYTLDPLPENIKKLHLQPHTISKPKFMAKPSPPRSPDTLEMFATVVSSQAMEDTPTRERALAQARKPAHEQEEHSESPRNDISPKEEGNKPANTPANGGPIKICKGCIERELKRADRKKLVNPNEQEEWKTLGAQRTVVFNNAEVIEWKQPTPFVEKSNNAKERPQTSSPYELPPPQFSHRARQVDIPTRIACYCRHHEEKVGFRIIFTIKDYQDKVVAQMLSSSIMITDDHKTHPGTHPLQDVPMVQPPQMPSFNPSPFASGPANIQQPNNMFSRNAFSSSDLSRLYEQSSHSRFFHETGPYHHGQNASSGAPAALTPRNFSRPASPTLPMSQQAKRRKGSGSARIRNELVMTAMPTKFPNSPITPPSSALSTGLSPEMFLPNNAGNRKLSPNYTEPAGFTYPPTALQYPLSDPLTTLDTTYHPPVTWNQGQRSQSMENLTSVGASASSSVMPSRGPSPLMINANSPSNIPKVVDPRPYGEARKESGEQMRQLGRMFPGSLNPINTPPNANRLPVLQKITPAEGSMAGGTEVSCLGEGFYPGLEIMFGDAPATITSFWGSNILLCQTPPALRAGVVAVTFKHHYEQKVEVSLEQQQSFRYIDNDNVELIRMMYALVSRNMDLDKNGIPKNGAMTDEAMRNIVANQMTSDEANRSPTKVLRDEEEKQHRSPNSAASMSPSDVEALLMQCLEQMDLDETLGQANLNHQGPNGQTLLHFTAALGYYRVTAGLLTRGAHPDVGDRNGMSPLHLAALHGHSRIIRKLRAAGSDPTLRSLNGFTPADMTNRPEIQDAINALDQRSRSQSAAATPATGLSRAPSVRSQASSGDGYGSRHAPFPQTADFERFGSRPPSGPRLRHRSRRNSSKSQDHPSSDITRTVVNPSASQLETQSALTAWRDQLSMQIQHFQETVHRALPPLPNLPTYQYYPVVRRISSLVPQRNNTPLVSNAEIQSAEKDGHYGWLELVLGPREPPPPYGDLPTPKSPDIAHRESTPGEEKAVHELTAPSDAKAPLVRAAVDSFMDQKCEAAFDHHESSSEMETINIGANGLTQQEQDRVRSAYAKKVKKLRKDRNFLFIWLPLFILFLLVALRDGASHVAYVTGLARSFYQDHRGERLVEEVA